MSSHRKFFIIILLIPSLTPRLEAGIYTVAKITPEARWLGEQDVEDLNGQELKFILRNVWSSDLSFRASTPSILEGDDVFKLVPPIDLSPLPIGSTREFRLQYLPKDLGYRKGRIRFSFTDALFRDAILTVDGLGTSTSILSFLSPHPFRDANFGKSVASLPDITEDGFDELLVCESGRDNEVSPESPSGLVHLFDAKNGNLIDTIPPPNASPNWDIRFGLSVSPVGDIDGDGSADIIVAGAEVKESSPVQSFGTAYVFNGKDRILIHSLLIMDETPTDDRVTYCHAVPDLNGDGVHDIVLSRLIGSRWLHLFDGRTGHFISSLGGTASDVAEILDVEQVHDVNHDGYPELGILVSDNRCHLFDLLNRKHLHEFRPPQSLVGGRFRDSLTGIGDINGNGSGDLGIIAAYEFKGHKDYRAICMFDGGSGDLLNVILSPQGESNLFARSIVAGNTREGRAAFLATTSNDFIQLFDPRTDWPLVKWSLPDKGYGPSEDPDLRYFPDLNGDGVPELLYAPAQATIGSLRKALTWFAGRVYILLSSAREEPPPAHAVLDKSEVVFPVQAIGKPLVEPIEIILTNTGPGDLYFNEIGFELVGTHTKDFTIPSKEFRGNLPAGATRTLRIGFRPTGTGSRTAEMVIYTNSVPESILRVPLSGYYTAPPPRTQPGVLYVSPTGSNFSGESWEHAYTTITRALEFALPGDQIWVKEGTYPEYVNLRSNVELYGGFMGKENGSELQQRDWKGHPSIIRPKDDRPEKSVITASGILNSTLDGFQIQGGRKQQGGGIFGFLSEFTLSNCVVKNCEAELKFYTVCYYGCSSFPTFGVGAGAYLLDCTRVVVHETSFVENRGGFGGAIYADNSQVELRKVVFLENYGQRGGAVFLSSSLLLANRCRFGENKGRDLRYVSYVGGPCRYPTSGGCYNNITSYSTEPGIGGAVFAENGSQLVIENSLFFGSEADSQFPLLRSHSSDTQLINCSIIENRPGKTDFFGLTNSNLFASNTIIDTTSFEPFHVSNATVEIDHSLLSFPWSGEGNIEGKPIYLNPENNDFRLRAGSPGLDEGAPVDLNIDYEGNPRPVDFPTLGANGIGHGYDIGAYERPLNGYYEDRFLPFNNPNSDIDGDGKVDLIDLQILLEDWGRVSGASNR